MKHIKKHPLGSAGIALLATLSLGGCASMHTKTAKANGSTASQAIAQAAAAVKQAAPQGALWSVSVQDLAKAKKAEAAGDDAAALHLAHEVLRQVALAKAQARAGANAKPTYPGT